MTKKNKMLARVSGSICGTLVATLIAIPSMYVYYQLNRIVEPAPNIDNGLNETVTPSEIVTNEGIDTNTLEGYQYIAIFGLDSRNGSYDAGNRSDTIMIASINNDTSEIKLISIYRDTYLDIPNKGLDKITHAYAYGGPKLAISTLNRNLDLDIKDYISINWFAAAKAVDILNGVKINVKSTELRELNRVIQMTNKSFSNKSSTLANSGTQTLNGIQAVSYARMRKVGHGDFERTERQQAVLNAAFKKAKKAKFTQIVSLINTIAPEISTNLNISDMLTLAKPAMKYNITDTTGFPKAQKGKMIQGVYYGLSDDLPTDVSNLHEFLFNEPNYTVSSTVKQIQTKINNKLAVASKSTKAVKEEDTIPVEAIITPEAITVDDDEEDEEKDNKEKEDNKEASTTSESIEKKEKEDNKEISTTPESIEKKEKENNKEISTTPESIEKQEDSDTIEDTENNKNQDNAKSKKKLN